MDKNENAVYIVFSRTNTGIGKIIRFLTRNEYSHVSIGLDERLLPMYSFARRYKNSPFNGGFVAELPSRYLSGGEDIKVKVCRVTENDVPGTGIADKVRGDIKNPERLIYDCYGALSSLFGRQGRRENAYTCLEYAASLLGCSECTNIRLLENRLSGTEVYIGSYGEYLREKCGGIPPAGGEEYYEKQPFLTVASGTIRHFAELSRRKK